jgi:hypothetical protein
MKIHILTYDHNEYGNVVSYHGSRQSAERSFAEQKRKAEAEGDEASNRDIRKHEVPNTKKGVIAFLNRFTPSHDNG